MRRSKQFILLLLSAALALVSLSDSQAFLTFHKAFPEASLVKKLFSITVCGKKNPEDRFVIDSKYVCDRTTGDVWEQDPDSYNADSNPDGRKPMEYDEAVAFCAALDNGYGQVYELPSIQQLEGVLDYSEFQPALTPGVFRNVEVFGLYRSATAFAAPEPGHWLLSLQEGNNGIRPDEVPFFVWCVRRDKDVHAH